VLKTRTWILIFAGLLLISGALALWLPTRKAAGTVANIYVDGQCVRSIDLSAVTEPFTFSVAGERGENRITVEPGRICVSHADCPDQICVQAGWLTDSASPIVCLPHHLVIRLERAPGSDGGAIDSVSR